MNFSFPLLNLELAWLWIVLGFISGLLLGLFFHREDWLGGYNSFKRRLYRLGHISFFGLGVVNFCFYFTARALAFSGVTLTLAAWAFLVGAIAMPICCLIMAHFPKMHLLFSVPVVSLLLGGMVVVAFLFRVAESRAGVPPAFPSAGRRDASPAFIEQKRNHVPLSTLHAPTFATLRRSMSAPISNHRP